jgi:TolB-like protein
MGDDEQKTFELLKKNRDLHKPIIEEFGGRWIKELGDGLMISFNTVTDAVMAALKIQEATQQLNEFELRIGIHLGEVVFDNGDVFGDGVNIASRIQSQAKPGTIYISESVHQNVSNKKGFETRYIKQEFLKNVKEPVRIYEVMTAGKKYPAVTKELPQKSPIKCIAVLPFLNLSNDPSLEYFSDGLTEELISHLSRLKDMRVISRTTSMKYKGTKKDIKTIGMETGASYIMEGSVRIHGNNLRITAQFVDANRDIHLWAESYNGTLDDIFDIQEKVSAKIVSEFRLQLTKDEKDSLQKRYTENTEAFQLYLQGRYFWNKRNEEGLNTAIRYFEKAIETDPDYALAWAGLADTYNLLGEFTNRSRRELYPKAKRAVSKALEIDNQLAEAHISFGLLIMLNEWDWINSGNEYQAGIKLNPNYATGHHWYAEWLLFMGRTTEAIEEISIAVNLDPVSPAILKDQGMTFYYARQYDQAIDTANKTLELNPDFATAYRLLSLAYQGKGMFDKAIEENQRWGKYNGNKVKTDISLAQIYAAAGRKEEALKIIEEVETEMALTGNDYRGMALIYVALEKPDEAFEWLEKSYEQHEESLCNLKVDPKLDSLRADPRFITMLHKVGLSV